MGKAGWIVGGVLYLAVMAAAAYTGLGLFVLLLFVSVIGGALVFGRRQNKLSAERNEALFVSTFPDLQPWYHPKQIYDYASARLAAGAPPRSGKAWKGPPGFTGRTADIRYEDEREVVRILDAAGALLTQFIFEPHKEGAAIRVGRGKFTVTTLDKAYPRVRYWHPDREFKWTPLTWKFMSRVADREYSSSDRSYSTSSDSSSSSSSSRVASAAPFAAAGGAFDGGGASQSWSEGGASASGSASTSY